ncbi:MAG TPA: 16S rRNA (cytosine(1402)-N(4))-methyltransferase RsmH [Saprospiraceae bacterium]|jgi:16S rRNA (cytosine1402-N4)-methyltransferase|nr:16S rRNA (cytosine(1402)-N(4))-methyltransferase RsmH [Saprospiraceae bacterium]HQW95089.1 16S rRNA (cytosine(1402)-N(4))-methyltransferase RsmH [Saprospiraceae bacterium]HRG44073.1 16S rRNA (cytosine(1402)-N(4))-methyltransferase RsmH [Saprospiraceae bacterium]
MNGYHLPVLLTETIEALDIKPDGTYVDVTFGGGGHSRMILERLGSNGRLFVMDQDLDTIQNIPNDERVTFIHSNFRYLKRMLRVEKVFEVDGILADIGVSSHQFDSSSRGFSFRFEGALDMRMNRELEQTAADIIMTYDEDALVEMFSTMGEVRNSKTLARLIVENRRKSKIRTIEEFIHLIQPAIMGSKPKYLAQVFQALRIEVNDELKALEDLLYDAYEVLKPDGIVAVITFHSLEDRIVKNFFKTGNPDGTIDQDDYGKIFRPFKVINKKPIEPGFDEIKTNNRARSAKLRVAKRSGE